MRILFIFCLMLTTAFSQSETQFMFKGYQAFVLRPAVPNGKWVWVMPAWIANTGAWDYYLSEALAKGFTVAGLEIGVTLGSPVAAKINSQFYYEMRRRFHLNRKVSLLLQSNGNTSGIAWAENRAKFVDRILAIYPVFNLRSWPGVEGIAGVINPKFLFTEREVTAYQPFTRLAGLAGKHVPFYVLHGDADTTVPLVKNSMLAKGVYKAQGGDMELHVIKGKGHEPNDPAFHADAHAAAFLVGE